jgi:dipeptidyl aminopeptidase/acylaminoacyl peptidase
MTHRTPARVASAFLALVSTAALRARAEAPPLVPRDVLFGNPQKTLPKISPDGKRLAFLAPDAKNVLQVFVQEGAHEPKQVTQDKKRGIRSYFFAHDNRTLLYLQDADGDENFHVYGVDLPSGNVRDYTPFQGTRAAILALEPDFPDELLVTLNLRNRQLFDVHRITLSTGAIALDTENPGDLASYTTDARMQVRGADVVLPDGGNEIRVRAGKGKPWRTLLKVGPDDSIGLLDFSKDGQSVFIESSLGRDTSAVIQRTLASGAEKVLASSPEVDAGAVFIQPRTHVAQAVSFEPGRRSWTVLDPAVKDDFSGIAKLFDGDFAIGARDDADQHWIVNFTNDRGSNRAYLWDRARKAGTLLFETQPKLDGYTLAHMQPVSFPARDGLPLHGYLTLPAEAKQRGLPLVLLVHGGPWSRDFWGFNPYAQWLANRGYAVLQINYRASTGYGKKFRNAGNRQWGLKMHDDLLDGVGWAVKEGHADEKKAAVFGGSYGGYAALAAVTFTPEVFACAVDIVGPSNLKTLIGAIPPYWKSIRGMFDVRMGNVDDARDEQLIHDASPLFKADKIVRPLLIGQGANDPRVNVRESEQIVSAIEKNGGKVTYVLYGDEGHGFARPENRNDFNARAELFLAGCLGGRAEPLQGDKVPGSSAVVRVVSGGERAERVK